MCVRCGIMKEAHRLQRSGKGVLLHNLSDYKMEQLHLRECEYELMNTAQKRQHSTKLKAKLL